MQSQKRVKNYGGFYRVESSKKLWRFLLSEKIMENHPPPPLPPPPTPKLTYFYHGGFSKGGWKGFLLANVIESSLHLAFYTGQSIHF
jgi:hypothetical protein